MNPAKSAKKSKATVHDEPKISPTVQIKEFPNEFLTVSNSKLFCSACREPFRKAGVPLAKIDCFRELLEESAYVNSHFYYTFGSIIGNK